jgi:hypothetical protein
MLQIARHLGSTTANLRSLLQLLPYQPLSWYRKARQRVLVPQCSRTSSTQQSVMRSLHHQHGRPSQRAPPSTSAISRLTALSRVPVPRRKALPRYTLTDGKSLMAAVVGTGIRRMTSRDLGTRLYHLRRALGLRHRNVGR